MLVCIYIWSLSLAAEQINFCVSLHFWKLQWMAEAEPPSSSILLHAVPLCSSTLKWSSLSFVPLTSFLHFHLSPCLFSLLESEQLSINPCFPLLSHSHFSLTELTPLVLTLMRTLHRFALPHAAPLAARGQRAAPRRRQPTLRTFWPTWGDTKSLSLERRVAAERRTESSVWLCVSQ